MATNQNANARLAVTRGIKFHAGFSLVELLVTIAIFGVLAAIALPNFSQMIQDQKVRGATSDLFGAMLFARSEAVKRNAVVRVTRSGAAWEAGWAITNSDGSVVFKRQDPLTSVTITSPAGNSVAFGGNGRPLAGAIGDTFMIYSTSRPEGLARCVSLGLSGIASVKADPDTDRTNGC